MRYQASTSTESLSAGVRFFWVFVFPTGLLAITLVALGIVVGFLHGFARDRYSFLQRGSMALALATMALALPLYYSPFWKYGLWVAFGALVAVVAAAACLQWLTFTVLVCTRPLPAIAQPHW